MLEGIWNNWFWMALLNPVAWSLGCLLDVCLIDRKVYRAPIEAVIVSGFFMTLPLFIVVFSSTIPLSVTLDAMMSVSDMTAPTALLDYRLSSGVGYSAIAGLGLVVHLYFYYKALFIVNDASKLEIYNLLSVLLVPILSLLLLQERLSVYQYIAVIIAGYGTILLIRSNSTSGHKGVAICTCISVFAISLSMVFQVLAFELLPMTEVMAWYFASIIFCAVAPCFLNRKIGRRIMRLFQLFALLFIASESIQIVAVVASQRAIGLNSSASLVAVVECALPLLIVVVSGTALMLMKISRYKNNSLHGVLWLQLSDFKEKTYSLVLISLAIGIVSWWNII